MEDRGRPGTRTYTSCLSSTLRPCTLTASSRREVEGRRQWRGGFGIVLEVHEWGLSLCSHTDASDTHVLLLGSLEASLTLKTHFDPPSHQLSKSRLWPLADGEEAVQPTVLTLVQAVGFPEGSLSTPVNGAEPPRVTPG